MTTPFFAHGQARRRWISVGTGSSATARRAACRSAPAAPAASRGSRRVVRGQELREDVAAADGAGERRPPPRRLRQVGERVRRAHDLEPSPASSSTLLVTVTGKASLAVAALGQQAHVEQQRLVDRHLVPLVVDEVEALARLVEHRAEVGADRRHEPPVRGRSPARASPARRAPRRRSRGRRSPRRPPGRRRAGARRTRRVAVVDDDPEAALADRVGVERVEQVLA